MSSLTCKCVFYRPEHNAKVDAMEPNFEGFEMQKRNISTDGVQKVDEKNRVICLVILLTPRVRPQFLDILFIVRRAYALIQRVYFSA